MGIHGLPGGAHHSPHCPVSLPQEMAFWNILTHSLLKAEGPSGFIVFSSVSSQPKCSGLGCAGLEGLAIPGPPWEIGPGEKGIFSFSFIQTVTEREDKIWIDRLKSPPAT